MEIKNIWDSLLTFCIAFKLYVENVITNHKMPRLMTFITRFCNGHERRLKWNSERRASCARMWIFNEEFEYSGVGFSVNSTYFFIICLLRPEVLAT